MEQHSFMVQKIMCFGVSLSHLATGEWGRSIALGYYSIKAATGA